MYFSSPFFIYSLSLAYKHQTLSHRWNDPVKLGLPLHCPLTPPHLHHNPSLGQQWPGAPLPHQTAGLDSTNNGPQCPHVPSSLSFFLSMCFLLVPHSYFPVSIELNGLKTHHSPHFRVFLIFFISCFSIFPLYPIIYFFLSRTVSFPMSCCNSRRESPQL